MFWEAGCLRAYLCLLVVRCFVVLLSAVVCGGVLKAGWFPYSSVVCLLLFSCSLPGCSLPWVFYCVLFTVIRVRIQKTNAGLVAGFGQKACAPVGVVVNAGGGVFARVHKAPSQGGFSHDTVSGSSKHQAFLVSSRITH